VFKSCDASAVGVPLPKPQSVQVAPEHHEAFAAFCKVWYANSQSNNTQQKNVQLKEEIKVIPAVSHSKDPNTYPLKLQKVSPQENRATKNEVLHTPQQPASVHQQQQSQIANLYNVYGELTKLARLYNVLVVKVANMETKIDQMHQQLQKNSTKTDNMEKQLRKNSENFNNMFRAALLHHQTGKAYQKALAQAAPSDGKQ